MLVLENKMDEIKSKLNKIADDIVEIKITLAAQHTDIAHHIKRSDLLEDKLDLVKDHFEAEIQPLKDHVTQVQGAKNAFMLVLKILAVTAAILTALAKAKGLF